MFGFKKRDDSKDRPESNKQPANQTKDKPKPLPPKVLGNGMARKAGEALKDRHRKIDEIAGYANGGLIRGPGTGVSDDIDMDAAEGSYIMPADSTQAIGPVALAAAGSNEPEARGFSPRTAGGSSVPIKVSNGEFALPPEQVHAIGAQVLNQAKDATHTPTGRPKTDGKDIFFADGGEVEEERRRQSPSGLSRRIPGLAPFAEGSNTRGIIDEGMKEVRDNFSRGEYAKGFGTGVRASLGAVPAYLADRQAAVDRNMEPIGRAAVGFGKGLFGIDDSQRAPTPEPPAAPGSADGASTAQGAEQSEQPAAQAAAEEAAAESAATTTPAAGQQLTNNVTRDGNSFYASGPISEGFTINGQAQTPRVTTTRSPQNEAAVQSLMRRTPRFGEGAPQAEGFQAGGPRVTYIPDSSRADSERSRAFAAASTPHRGAQNGQLTASQLNAMRGLISDQDAVETSRYNTDAGLTREAISQAGADRRAADRNALDAEISGGRQQVDEGRLSLDERQSAPQLAQAERVERLYQAYENADTPEEKSAVAEQLRLLSGGSSGNARDNYITLGGGQEWDPAAGMMVNRPQQLFDIRNQQLINPAGSSGEPQPMPPRDQLRVGVIYQTARGPASWDGSKFIPVRN